MRHNSFSQPNSVKFGTDFTRALLACLYIFPSLILTIRRLLYHYHIITRDDKETIKKVYLKQKEACVKGDWITLLAKDFNFNKLEQNGEYIMRLGKKEYCSYIKRKAKNAALNLHLNHIRNNRGKNKRLFLWTVWTTTLF